MSPLEVRAEGTRKDMLGLSNHMHKASPELTAELLRMAADLISALAAENQRLQRVIDSRPAINAGLPETYVAWSQSIYAMEMLHASEVPS